MAKSMKCPKCKSTNIQVLGNDRKGFSIGKAVGGALLTGGIGTLAGFAGNNVKYEVVCLQCGHRWKVKLGMKYNLHSQVVFLCPKRR